MPNEITYEKQELLEIEKQLQELQFKESFDGTEGRIISYCDMRLRLLDENMFDDSDRSLKNDILQLMSNLEARQRSLSGTKPEYELPSLVDGKENYRDYCSVLETTADGERVATKNYNPEEQKFYLNIPSNNNIKKENHNNSKSPSTYREVYARFDYDTPFSWLRNENATRSIDPPAAKTPIVKEKKKNTLVSHQSIIFNKNGQTPEWKTRKEWENLEKQKDPDSQELAELAKECGIALLGN